MNKTIIFTAIVIVGLVSIFATSSLDLTEEVKLKTGKKEFQISSPNKTIQSTLREEAPQTVPQYDKSALTNLSDKQLRQKLQRLNTDLEPDKFKNYSDFSEQDLQIYNRKVRESVQIKKILFLRKYASWNNT